MGKRKERATFVVTTLQKTLFPINPKLTNNITAVLSKVPIVKNVSGKKFMALFTLGLIKSRNVEFCQRTHHLNNEAKLSSNQVRLQDFFRQVAIDYFSAALLLLQLLVPKEKLGLCIEGTAWDFGRCQVSVLMILIG